MRSEEGDDRAFIRNYVERAVSYQKPLGIPISTFQVYVTSSEIAEALGQPRDRPLQKVVSNPVVSQFIRSFAPAARDVAGGGEHAGELGGHEALQAALRHGSKAPYPLHFDVSHMLVIVDNTPNGSISELRKLFQAATEASVIRFSERDMGSAIALPLGSKHEQFRFDRNFYLFAGPMDPGDFAPVSSSVVQRCQGHIRLFGRDAHGIAAALKDGLAAAAHHQKAVECEQAGIPDRSEPLQTDLPTLMRQTERRLDNLIAYCQMAAQAEILCPARRLYQAARSVSSSIPGHEEIASDVRYLGHHLLGYQLYASEREKEINPSDRVMMVDVRPGVGDVQIGRNQSGLFCSPAHGFSDQLIEASQDRLERLAGASSRLADVHAARRIQDAPAFWTGLGLQDPLAGLGALNRTQIGRAVSEAAAAAPGGVVKLYVSREELAASRGIETPAVTASGAIVMALRTVATDAEPSQHPSAKSVAIVEVDARKAAQNMTRFLVDSRYSDENVAFLAAALRESLRLSLEREAFIDQNRSRKEPGRER
jgi:hypothetical protein